MHELVERIKKPELCYVFAKNAIARGHDALAIEAYRHAVDLRAAEHEVSTEVEMACSVSRPSASQDAAISRVDCPILSGSSFFASE